MPLVPGNNLSIDASQLDEPESVDLFQQIQLTPVTTPFRTPAIKTSYVVQGHGGVTPMILLHGFDSSLLEFRRLFPLLAEHQETWALDLLGFGFTERMCAVAPNPATIRAHLYSVWQQLIKRPVTLVGASMGGAVALDFCLQYPNVVEKLILLDSAGIQSGPVIGKFLFPPLDTWAVDFLQRPGVRRNISLSAYCDRKWVTPDAEACAALHLQMPHWHESLKRFTKSGGYGSYRKQLHTIQQPTLIVWGRQDKILGTKDALVFAERLPTNKLIWIEQCGHVPHLEQAVVTSQHILEFVS